MRLAPVGCNPPPRPHMPHRSSALVVAAAVVIVFTAYFIRRRRHRLPMPPRPQEAIPDHVLLPTSILVAGRFFSRSQILSLSNCCLTRPRKFQLVASDVLDQRIRRQSESVASSSTAAASLVQLLAQSSASPSLAPRSSTQDISRRLLSDSLPEPPPPVISPATRAFVAELQNKYVVQLDNTVLSLL
jgi:hypothetical protein